MEKSSLSLDKTLNENLIKKIIDNFQGEIIILYGSHSYGQADEYSDVDLAVISNSVNEINFYENYEFDKLIDCIIIPKQQMIDFFELQQAKQDQIFKRLHAGMVIYQENNMGTELLAKIEKIISKGPQPLTNEAKASKILWINKMLNRIHSKDVARHFRSYELLISLLENYFYLRDLWYFGIRKSFNFLKEHDTITFDLFCEISNSGINPTNLEELVGRVINIAVI